MALAGSRMVQLLGSAGFREATRLPPGFPSKFSGSLWTGATTSHQRDRKNSPLSGVQSRGFASNTGGPEKPTSRPEGATSQESTGNVENSGSDTKSRGIQLDPKNAAGPPKTGGKAVSTTARPDAPPASASRPDIIKSWDPSQVKIFPRQFIHDKKKSKHLKAIAFKMGDIAGFQQYGGQPIPLPVFGKKHHWQGAPEFIPLDQFAKVVATFPKKK